MKKNTLAIVPSVLALAIGMGLPIAQAQVNTDASILGSESQWWNTYKVTLTNDSSNPIELRDAKIVYDSNLSMSAPNWSASGVSYPSMAFTSDAQGNLFKNTLTLGFDNGSWVKSQLLAGEHIELTLGVSGVLDLNLLQDSILLITDDETGVGEPEISLQLVSPINDAEFEEGQYVAILANVEANNTDVESVTFFVDNNQVSQVTQAPFQANWTSVGIGAHTIKAKVEDTSGLTQQQTINIIVKEQQVELPVIPEVSFSSPSNASMYEKDETVSISVRATDANDDLSSVIVKANNKQICEFNASTTNQFSCNWTASEVGVVTLDALATDAQNLTSTARVKITVEEVETPTPPPGGLCTDFNIYPDWTHVDHATGGDIMVHNNIAYSANYWTNSVPGSDGSWALHLNCDGTEPGTAPALSLRNPMDPVRLEVLGWPNTFVVASPSTHAPSTLTVEANNSDVLTNTEQLKLAFVSVIKQAENAEPTSILIKSDILDLATPDKGVSFGTVAVKQALNDAINITRVNIDVDDVNSLTDDVKGWALAHNLIFTTLAPQATFGWSLSIGDFAYDTHSGRQSVWDEASVFTADLLDSFKLYEAGSENKADFVVFTKSDATAALTSEQWHHALEYVKQVTDYIEAPAMLANIPTEQAANYFMGKTQSEQKIRKAAYSNIFALMYDQDSEALTSKVALYQTAKVPLYYVGEELEQGSLTRIEALNQELADAENVMNNEAFLYETPQSQWVPSTVYKWNDFLDGLNAMHNIGVAGNKFWLMDDGVNDETNIKYAKVAIAAFLAQSMQETIRYNACDENNWSEVKYGAPTDYPMTASCGQLGQKYADYGVNPVSGLDHAYSCPRDDKMEVSALTHAKWYGAPAPVFATPDAVLEERGLLINGAAGRWTNNGHCNDVPESVDTSKQVWERDECKTYVGQNAGKFIWDGSSQESVEGCGWWGRGVIQTTGRQNFGTLNHYLGRSHIDPSTIGKTIDGVTVEAPPANPLYAELDFCSNPGLICSSEENKEIKWIAGLFYWVTSVQAYNDEGGQYADWNYYNELKNYVDNGLQGSQFIDDVSGIVNRGCPDLACSTGDVHNIEERRNNFKLVLQKLGLDPR